jgi:predicted enzyme related to lactoylglutathione lyase
MLRGLTTVSYFAEDVMAAQGWYSELLGTEPYFVRPAEGPPAYVEYRIGDYQHELGIVDRRFARTDGTGGAVVYWHVDDVRACFERLLSMGATVHDEPVERGPGFGRRPGHMPPVRVHYDCRPALHPTVPLKAHRFHGEWNYSIAPRPTVD